MPCRGEDAGDASAQVAGAEDGEGAGGDCGWGVGDGWEGGEVVGWECGYGCCCVGVGGGCGWVGCVYVCQGHDGYNSIKCTRECKEEWYIRGCCC